MFDGAIKKRGNFMKVRIQDIDALIAVQPNALFAYARAAGWEELEPYGDHSEVYVHREAPEIIVPKTQCLGDYANVVSRLIQIFAKVAESDELSVYRDLERFSLRLHRGVT